MSNKIGFYNFRRFAKFPEIDLGDITILVGGNNSGKSTLVKALLLCVDNLRLMRMNDRRRDESKSVLSFSKPLFRFDANEYHDVKVKTFARAIHNKPVEEEVDIAQLLALHYFAQKNGEELHARTVEGSPVEANEDMLSHDIMKNGQYKKVMVLPSTMTFHFTIDQFEFYIVVSGDRDNKKNITTGDVESISIVDHRSNVRYMNNYATDTMAFAIIGDNNNLSLLEKLHRDHAAAEQALEQANENGDLDEISRQTAALDKIAQQIRSLSESDMETEIEKLDSDPNVQKSIAQIEDADDSVERKIRQMESDPNFQRAIAQLNDTEDSAGRKIREMENDPNFQKVVSQLDDTEDSVERKIREIENDPNVQKFLSQMENEEDGDARIEKFECDLRNAINRAIPPKASYILPLGIFHNGQQEPVVLNVISNILFFANSKDLAPKMKEGEDPNDYAARVRNYMLMENYRESIKQEESSINRSYRDLKRLLDSLNLEYISSHSANQNTLYNTADRNDYIAQTVHEFYREKIVAGEKEYLFIQDWMKQFEIGADFDITSIDGEAYQVRIKDADGSSVPLADKGMGSIQMMILLLRLATIMRRNKNNNKEIEKANLFDDRTPPLPTTVIIEEPEQNLHPKMQSLLADLFCYLTREANLRFLIETHSEYLIRKSQVIVADQKFNNEEDLKENNPFKVYYLPTDDKLPYELLYRTDGCFVNDFGEGFFDEAEKLAFQVL